MKRETKEAILVVLLAVAAAAIIAFAAGCTRIEYVDRPTPVPSPTPTPTPAPVVCHSVPASQGDCHRTSDDVYLQQFTDAQERAGPTLVNRAGEITNGPAYLDFLILDLRTQGLCAGIYHEEEISIWSKTEQGWSEEWDAIAEPGDGRILPRSGPAAHQYTCNPATTESGS